MAVAGAQPSQAGTARGRHVGHPLGHFLHAARTEVAADIGVGADLLDQVEEFMGADGVVLLHPAPVAVHTHRPFPARADAVAPMVLVGEAAARPAHHRHVQLLERGHHVLAPAARVGNGRIGPDPHAAVDAGAEVLGELAVDMAVDQRSGPGGIDRDAHRFGRARRRRQHHAGRETGDKFHDSVSLPAFRDGVRWLKLMSRARQAPYTHAGRSRAGHCAIGGIGGAATCRAM